jgi:histidine decarboxylase
MIMVSRRQFLGHGLAGMISVAAGCRPVNFSGFPTDIDNSHDQTSFVQSKKGLFGRQNYFLGYPINMSTPSEGYFAWREELRKIGIGTISYNNVGNPFTESSIAYNSHELERELILRFGQLFGFQKSDTWGFISHSGTDSNMHGMYMGRTILKARSGIEPKCYFTKEAHYSIQILSDLLGMDRIFVNTLPDASMDIDDLKEQLARHNDHPALIVATIGTTFKGAIDNVDQILQVLTGHEHYIHLDAALFGGYLPHTHGAEYVSQKRQLDPFSHRYDSIAVSCHKFFGFPAPAGLYITTSQNYERFEEKYSTIHNPEYIGHVPGTITCSRDAVKPAEFYYFTSEDSKQKQREDATNILKNTDYLMDQMKRHLERLQPVRFSSLSNTIYFRKPADYIVRKYSLATMHLEIDGKKDHFAHVVIMPHVSKKVLDEFLTDLQVDRSLQI